MTLPLVRRRRLRRPRASDGVPGGIRGVLVGALMDDDDRRDQGSGQEGDETDDGPALIGLCRDVAGDVRHARKIVEPVLSSVQPGLRDADPNQTGSLSVKRESVIV